MKSLLDVMAPQAQQMPLPTAAQAGQVMPPLAAGRPPMAPPMGLPPAQAMAAQVPMEMPMAAPKPQSSLSKAIGHLRMENGGKRRR